MTISNPNVRTDLVPALRCVNCLIRREEEETNLTLLYSYIARKNDIPVALGKGCTRLADKCCALSHKWWFLTGTKPAFEAYRRSYCSYCTDLGTEVNIGDFHVDDDVLSMLPSQVSEMPHQFLKQTSPLRRRFHMLQQVWVLHLLRASHNILPGERRSET